MEKTSNAKSKYDSIIDATLAINDILDSESDYDEIVRLNWMKECLGKIRKKCFKEVFLR